MVKKIKEERETRPDNIKNPFFDFMKALSSNSEDNKFEERTTQFWEDEDGIINLLNKTDPKNSNTTFNSPIITHYWLWRILEELKRLKLPRKRERE